MNKFLKAFMAVTTISIATRCLCFFFKIFLSRTLSLETLGSYQIAMNIYMVFLAVVTSGLPITMSREVAFDVSRGDLLTANKKATAGLLLAVIFSVVSCVGMFATSFFIEQTSGDFLEIASFSILTFGVYSVARGYLWGKREFFMFSFLEFLEEVFTFAFAFLFIKLTVFDSGIQNIALAFTISSLACGIMGVYSFFKKGGKIIYAKSHVAKVAKSSSFITIMRIAGTIFASIYTLCLPKFLMASGFSQTESLETVGLFYGMVAPLLFIPSALVSGLSLVLIPEIASFASDKKAVSKTVIFAMRFAVLFAVVFVPFYQIFGEQITTFLFKNRESGRMLRFASIAVLPISANLLLSGFMNGLSLEKYNFAHFFASGIFCFSMLFPATMWLGEYGIILIFTIQPTIPLVLNLRIIAKKNDMKLRSVLSSLAPALLGFPCVFIALLLAGITASLPTFFTLAISGMGIFAFCGGLFFVFFYPLAKKA